MTETIPLSLLASEWGVKPEQLIADLGADQIVTDDLAIRHVRRSDAAVLLERRQRQAADRAARDAARRAALGEQSNRLHRRVRALKHHQARLRANGTYAPDLTAHGVMCGAEKEGQLARKGRYFDELLGAGNRGDYGTMHTFHPQKG